MGNHTYDNRESGAVLEENENVIRPINFPSHLEGSGYTIYDTGSVKIAVVNLSGRVGMQPIDCPFKAMESLLPKLDADIIAVDFHAEATSEKIAMAYFLDGKVSCVFGTHTHVQTADENFKRRYGFYMRPRNDGGRGLGSRDKKRNYNRIYV